MSLFSSRIVVGVPISSVDFVAFNFYENGIIYVLILMSIDG